ncbi:hypothetical protein AWW66_11805 [Micromonospora rosaria]|uniref:Lipoprotein n=1 Tax=Micromonospora rosaria TaxID=47874 RepID=A0A136PTQ7_9ACTN|nr:hypothetical protein [Micromonospora rosaria]KXK61793.1 hypothetical protein AWW66_11805 [Micromonospora rosaria]
MRTLRIFVAALVAGALLSACGAQGGDVTPAPGTTGETSVSTDPSTPAADPTDPAATPPAHRPSRPAASAPAKSGTTTLTGTVTAGVEPGCLLLDGYLLLGGAKDVVKAGARVTVTGKVEEGMMTTCQQGTPFVVSSATPA